jgi:hypothetical protein
VLEAYLLANPNLHIYSVLSHEPIVSFANYISLQEGKLTMTQLADSQRIGTEDNWYIDEFGRYVYIEYRIGTKADEDQRFDLSSSSELFETKYHTA